MDKERKENDDLASRSSQSSALSMSITIPWVFSFAFYIVLYYCWEGSFCNNKNNNKAYYQRENAFPTTCLAAIARSTVIISNWKFSSFSSCLNAHTHTPSPREKMPAEIFFSVQKSVIHNNTIPLLYAPKNYNYTIRSFQKGNEKIHSHLHFNCASSVEWWK